MTKAKDTTKKKTKKPTKKKFIQAVEKSDFRRIPHYTALIKLGLSHVLASKECGVSGAFMTRIIDAFNMWYDIEKGFTDATILELQINHLQDLQFITGKPLTESDWEELDAKDKIALKLKAYQMIEKSNELENNRD